jgi:hypothetical protein
MHPQIASSLVRLWQPHEGPRPVRRSFLRWLFRR